MSDNAIYSCSLKITWNDKSFVKNIKLVTDIEIGI